MKNKNYYWTKEEKSSLKKEYAYGNLEILSSKIHRTISSLKAKAKRLKLIRKVSPNLNSNNGMWVGNQVSYNALHSWVRTRKKKPKLCEDCKKAKPYDLANISGEYKRDIKDFKYVCRNCHMKNDGRLRLLKKAGILRRRKKKGNKLFCSKCKRYKKTSEFRKDNRKLDKHTSFCKSCLKKEYRRKNEKM